MSAGRFVTLARHEPDFMAYLLGKTPEGLRAVPVESFSVNTGRERVTFAVFATSSVRRPAWWMVLAKLLRLELAPLTLAPALAAVMVVRGAADAGTLAQMFLALFAIHVAAFTRNDFEDYIQGLDRLQRRRGSQVIERGWLTARTVARISWGALAVAAAAGLPLLLRAPLSLVLLGFLGLGAVLGFGFRGRGFKNQGFGEVVVGTCMGPLLTLGIGELFSPTLHGQLFLVGLPFGLAAVIYFQLRQLSSIMTERQVRSGSLVSRLGFDRAKLWLRVEIGLIPLALAVALISWVPIGVVAGAVMAAVFGQIPIQRELARARSPLASSLVGLSTRALAAYFALSLLIIGILGMLARTGVIG